jgi:hypothetical protein
MSTNKKIVRLLASLVLIGLSASAQANLIEWTYEATIVSTSTDPLGIDGETATISLTFDGAKTWEHQEITSLPLGFTSTGPLTFSAMNAVATISGGHTVNVTGAALFEPLVPLALIGDVISLITPYTSPTFFFETFTIDGEDTLTGLSGDSAITPNEGDHLLLEHLPTVISSAGINYPYFAGNSLGNLNALGTIPLGSGIGNNLPIIQTTFEPTYTFIKASTTITAVPEPSILALISLGLMGIGYRLNRSKR